MNIDQIFPSKWLKASDLPHDVRVKIQSASVENVRDGRTGQPVQKLIIAFAGKEKRLICNKTQAHAIAEAAGSRETDDWPGTCIIIGPATAHNGKPTIRVSAHTTHKGAVT